MKDFYCDKCNILVASIVNESVIRKGTIMLCSKCGKKSNNESVKGGIYDEDNTFSSLKDIFGFK